MHRPDNTPPPPLVGSPGVHIHIHVFFIHFYHCTIQIEKLSLDKDLPELQEEQLNMVDKQQNEYQITMLEERMKQMSPNLAAIEEYKKKVNLRYQ